MLIALLSRANSDTFEVTNRCKTTVWYFLRGREGGSYFICIL